MQKVTILYTLYRESFLHVTGALAISSTPCAPSMKMRAPKGMAHIYNLIRKNAKQGSGLRKKLLHVRTPSLLSWNSFPNCAPQVVDTLFEIFLGGFLALQCCSKPLQAATTHTLRGG